MTSPKVEPTAVTRPRTSLVERLLALAKTPDDRERAWQIAERVEQEQAIAAMVAEVRTKAWGNQVSPALQKEIVRWTLQQGGDPMTEVDILGGQPYLNNRYWLRLLANEPDFLRGEETQLADDARLPDEERALRRALRAMWGVPEEIAATVGLSGEQREAAKSRPPLKLLSAVLVALHFEGRGPFHGVKWCPSSAKDPVGGDFPEQTARTRAWRKAAVLAIRRKTPLTERLKLMIDDERHQPQTFLSDKGPGSVPLTDPERIEIAPLAAPQQISEGEPAPPQSPKMVRHEPSKICELKGDHDEGLCGYKRKGDVR